MAVEALEVGLVIEPLVLDNACGREETSDGQEAALSFVDLEVLEAAPLDPNPCRSSRHRLDYAYRSGRL